MRGVNGTPGVASKLAVGSGSRGLSRASLVSDHSSERTTSSAPDVFAAYRLRDEAAPAVAPRPDDVPAGSGSGSRLISLTSPVRPGSEPPNCNGGIRVEGVKDPAQRVGRRSNLGTIDRPPEVTLDRPYSLVDLDTERRPSASVGQRVSDPAAELEVVAWMQTRAVPPTPARALSEEEAEIEIHELVHPFHRVALADPGGGRATPQATGGERAAPSA